MNRLELPLHRSPDMDLWGNGRAQVLTVRFDPALEALHEATLQKFLNAKEDHAIREYFFVRDSEACLPVLVTRA